MVMLALYNLQMTGSAQGKKGYFRWKEHICAFIDRNWTSLFGHSRFPEIIPSIICVQCLIFLLYTRLAP